MNRKYQLCILSVLVISLIFIFTGMNFAQEKSYEGVTIRGTFGKFNETYALLDLCEEAAKQLGMNVEFVWYERDDVHKKYILDRRMNNPVWDIVMVDSFWIGEWIAADVVTPINAFVEESPELVDEDVLDLDDYYAPQIESFTYKGDLTGLPLYALGVCMFYRTDLFENPIEKENFKERYGYDLKVPETYKEFYDVVEFFTRKKGEKLMGEVLEHDFYGTVFSNKEGDFLWNDIDTIFMAFGADNIFDEKTLLPTFNSPQMIEAIKYYVSLNPFQPSGHINMTSGEATSLTAQGYVALQIEYFIRGIEILLGPDSSVADKISFTVNPSKEGVVGREHAAHMGGVAVGISSISKNKEAAYKLLELAMSKEIMRKVFLEKGLSWHPARKSLLFDEEIREKYPFLKEADKLLSEDIYYFQHPAYLIPMYQECVYICTKEMSKALIGEKTPEQACNDAQANLLEVFKREGYISE
ncbi:extracellular solute-binding protein [Atribacter laminatus]|uniref:Extracellular solute-binding protein n=1 Tax=Atribacter laminatus TaxID=2847778 RepID=A0A7T1F2M8_ATRLM|nr:extracellular solute-binding protein [Atribacter laminatus]QPM67935.1 hypothetical protein RT761_01148 [Atribacter laminatus]